MGSFASVASSWWRHVTNDINSSPSSAFTAGGTPVTTLSSLYIVGDTKNATECFLSGHGGLFEGNYFVDNTSFRVPAGITVQFYQQHGATLSFSTNALRLTGGQPLSQPGANDLAYTGGDDCPNYILSKDQGRHLGNYTDEQVDAWKMTYEGAQEVCAELGVVIVLVRNRWFHAGMTLKNVVNDVHKAVPGITTFKCLFCRVDDNSTGDDWNARTGVAS
ncbi:putative adhesin [Neoroseomonas soli]|uniref:Putative adhesin Stv domain-containing protein n=1 Tax=Neoroseomonas soli TaxID=1081025 RepID=A0A9X9X4D9_9PROT|nr:hypothetical protein [Neoroseomonas soli]MBR0674268.1 hypothetical protein [Neoroseomonas soli]